MLSYTLILALPALAVAGSAGGATWCAESDPRHIPDYICLTRITDACFACLGPIETAAGDEDADPTNFALRFCPDPSIKQGTAWNSIAACVNAANAPCGSDDYRAIFNTYGVECGTSASVRDVWNGEVCRANPSGDVAIQQLQKYNCDGSVPTTTAETTPASTASSSSVASGTSKTSTAVTTTSATTTKSQASSATGSATRPPTSTSTIPITNAAPNMAVNSFYALALALGGAAIHAL